MTTSAPSPAPVPSTDYPISTTFTLPDRIARWRPIVHWFLAIPHYIVSYFIAVVTEIVVVIGWFVGVITGKIPDFVLQFATLNLRYSNRLTTYVLFLRESYPPFDFDLTFADNGKDPHTRLDVVGQTEGRSRLTIFFRLLLVIPHAIVLGLLSIAVSVVAFIGWFAVIILGHWPAGLRSFLLGFTRWSNRVNGYFLLLTDDYPPFSLE